MVLDEVSRGARRWAMVSQLSMFAAQVVLPVALVLTIGRKSRFVREWALEALNFQLAWLVPFYALALFVGGRSIYVFYVLIAYFGLASIYAFYCGAMGAIRSIKGEAWRYPLNLRIFR